MRRDDGLLKYTCYACEMEFIVGEANSEGKQLSCPYCQSKNVEAIVMMTAEDERVGELGCMGILAPEK